MFDEYDLQKATLIIDIAKAVSIFVLKTHRFSVRVNLTIRRTSMNITKEMIKRQAREDILNARLVQEDIIETPFYVVKGGFATPELFNEIMDEEDPDIENIRINILKNEYFVVILNNRVDEDGNFEEHKRLSEQLKLKEIDNVIDEYYGYVLVPYLQTGCK